MKPPIIVKKPDIWLNGPPFVTVTYKINVIPVYQNISPSKVADPSTPVPAKAGSGPNNHPKHEPLIKDVLSQ